MYVVNATDGSPPVDGPEEEPTEEDRVHVLAQGGIAPEVVILFPDDPNDPIPDPACLVGLENCGAALTNSPVRTFWSQLNAE